MGTDKLKIVCTDGNFRYDEELRSIPHIRHVISKSETCLVESFNSVLRQHLARLHRKTKCYSKSLKMLELSLALFIEKFFC